jgi:DNA-binding FadR family transcriptional regulator
MTSDHPKPDLPAPEPGHRASVRSARIDLPSVVADEIRQRIVVGKLTPGDKLPTERELCDEHQVSRVVVREAIARLRHEGLVASHQGKGVFVASPENSRFLEISEQSLARPESYRQLFELRLVLESGTAALAAEHRDKGDLEAMAQCLEDMRSTRDYGTFVTADIGFHRAIAAATKNPFLGLFTSFVDNRLKESIALALKSLDLSSTVAVSAAEHGDIYVHIRAGSAAKASNAMRIHLTNASRRFGL